MLRAVKAASLWRAWHSMVSAASFADQWIMLGRLVPKAINSAVELVVYSGSVLHSCTT